MAYSDSIRSIARIVGAQRALEGGGFEVRRPFPTGLLNFFDPFLLLDRMGPSDLKPGQAKGAPDHPHRGFETVTYMLEGAMRHKDSQGNQGYLGPGSVQWMTAGSGVIHSEMPDEAFQKKGGRMHGFQLWVNLPKRDKMMAPRYQDTPAEKIPVAQTPDGNVKVKVIAGEALGKKAVIETRTPILYLHFTLQPGASFVQPVSRKYNVFAHVFGGVGCFGIKKAEEDQMVIFEKDGESVKLEASKKSKTPLDVLLIGGVPLNEPVARYGPFVMNTQAEIIQTIQDYQSGNFGVIRS